MVMMAAMAATAAVSASGGCLIPLVSLAAPSRAWAVTTMETCTYCSCLLSLSVLHVTYLQSTYLCTGLVLSPHRPNDTHT